MAAIRIYPGRTGMHRSLQEIAAQLAAPPPPQPGPNNALELLEREQRERRSALETADLRVLHGILGAHLDSEHCAKAVAAARTAHHSTGQLGKLRHRGWKPVRFQLRNGLVVHMHTPYLRPQVRRRGRRRGTGRRRAGGAGVFPLLAQLGIHQGVTPALREEVALQAVVSDSLREARTQLARDGVRLDIDTLIAVAVATGGRAQTLTHAALEQARGAALPTTSSLAGRRIQVSIDGGRARTRITETHSRVGKNGRRPFETAWREPRVVTLVVLDDNGGMDRRVKPIYLIGLGEADAVAAQVVGLLRHVGAHLAASVSFVCDGASWLWSRLPGIAAAAGLAKDRVEYVLDFWHACEYVHGALKLCKHFTEAERTALYQSMRREMRDDKDGVASVIQQLLKLAVGRRSRAIKEKVAYLKGHLLHTNYARLRAQHLPIGSGVVESAIRRVVNQRFKSASLFWRADHLEPLLNLRALWKSGRWDDFFTAQLQDRFWLHTTTLIPEDTENAQEKAA